MLSSTLVPSPSINILTSKIPDKKGRLPVQDLGPRTEYSQQLRSNLPAPSSDLRCQNAVVRGSDGRLVGEEIGGRRGGGGFT